MPVLDRFDMTGRTAVVTGSTRGLGRAFATALAEAGANVVVVGRDADAAATVEAELGALGADVLTVLADVTRRDDVERLLAAAVDRFGRVDVLVNNAGACIHKPALDVTDEEWHEVMSVNVDGLWIASQVFGRHMIERGGGSIVNVGSMSGAIVNRPQWQPAYNASKAAVHHLTRSLAAEWAPMHVRVNAIAPGYMRTDMAPVDAPEFHRHWIEDTPQQRAGEPDELGPAMVFLASDASSFVTGSVLTIDGGYTVF
ncbi:3-oxoacyl-ACP reductase [Curtobacterium sp. MCBD17_034]|uniref:SDR family NAD(P)-dependent oxidoreductase n=2 Tax=Curtobacterium TaxID=2034 RepID=UPI000DA89186|nr:glucose 1-dehydrogenase [Curtobacterium sp. MCBD17_040]PZF60123.1 3-oxoacyl-ACP reductase [Curtobacterium sp. MCBD17_034]PZF61720.1 3-oxoacyl-ACP reductase [Curtobacterium sp. MCBD17_013]PZM34808.1 3-oxoacyl-ACP reductase [Curtobacterium sp. MCBD17_031]WIB63449.1 glucose 1-dehydrogenase [Curtobacterium sp. MCBD17_040]